MMKRREFTLVATTAATALWAAPALAQNGAFQAGQDYRELDSRAPVEAPATKVEVVEFFWYSCPHCNAFEPVLEAWVKKLPGHVAFRRIPVAFNDSFQPQQRLYYTLEAMGLLEKLHTKVFAAIHVDKQRLAQASAIADWAVAQGLNREKFMAQFNSFNVVTRVNKATQLQNAYAVEGVPGLGVAGRFYTDGMLAKSMQRALLVVDALVANVRAGR